MKSFLILIVSIIQLLSQAQELGQGHISDRRLWTPVCVQGESGFRGVQQGVLRLDHSYANHSDLLHMNFTTSAGIDLGIVGASGSVSVDQVFRRSKGSWYLVFSSEIQRKSEALVNHAWTPYANEVRRFRDPTIFKDLCGDEFVKEVTKGVKIQVIARYKFKEKTSRTEMKTRIKVKVLVGTITKTVTVTNTLGNDLEEFDVSVIVKGASQSLVERHFLPFLNKCNPSRENCLNQINRVLAFIGSDQMTELLEAAKGTPVRKVFQKYSQTVDLLEK